MILVVVARQGDEFGIAVHAVDQLNHGRKLAYARGAVSRPEVQQHDFAFEIRNVVCFAVEIGEGKVRDGIAVCCFGRILRL